MKNVYVNLVWTSISHLSVQFMSYAWFRYLKSHQVFSLHAQTISESISMVQMWQKITAITFFSWMKYATQFTYANVLIQLKMWQQQHAHFTPCFQKVTNPPIANWSRVVQETILEIAWISKRNHLNAASLIVLWLVFVGSNSEIAFDSKKNLFYFYLLIIMKIFEEYIFEVPKKPIWSRI